MFFEMVRTPLDAATRITAAYAEENKTSPEELAVLFETIYLKAVELRKTPEPAPQVTNQMADHEKRSPALETDLTLVPVY